MMLMLYSLAYLSLICQTPDWLWARQAGGFASDFGRGIAVDSNGCSYVTGYFGDFATFGDTALTSFGEWDVFVAKLDCNGNWLWVKQAGGEGQDIGHSIAIGDNGDSYIIGSFSSTATFGSTTLTSNGETDIFVAKLDSNGNWLWARKAGGGVLDKGNGITTDSYGNCYVTGDITGTATFGSTTLISSGGEDIFMAKLDANGNWLWAKHAGGTNFDLGSDIVTDNNGNNYVTGWFAGTATFGSTNLISSGSMDIFVAKLDANGNWLWVIQAGGTYDDWGSGITTDSSGNCYVTGQFIFNGTFGNTVLTSNGGYDIFVVKLDSNGNWLWAKKAGGTSDDLGSGIAIDSSGNCFVTGYFSSIATFGSTTLSSSGSFEIFVSQIDSNGSYLWTQQAGGTGNDQGTGIATDSSGNCYVTGGFGGIATFSATLLTSSGNMDIFVSKLGSDVAIEDVSESVSPVVIATISPNPFSQKVVIELKDKADSNILLKVFNIRGQQVDCILFEESAARWQPVNQPSGIYLFKLYQNGSVVLSRKVTYIR